jgi:hypothetical protein
MNRIVKRLAVPLSAAAILGTAGFAYMATNTVGESYAGGGANQISGYTVSNISYGAKGGYIGSVSFSLSAPAKASNVDAKVQQGKGGPSYGFPTCVTNSGSDVGTAFTCTAKDPTHLIYDGQADYLTVDAAR